MKNLNKCCYLFCFLVLNSLNPLSGQDMIIFKNGDEVQAKVIEITDDNVRYHKWNNISGPSYTTSKAEVFMIKYANGTKDVFTQNVSNNTTNTNRNTDAVIDIARKEMTEIIAKESKGTLQLVSLQKENGILRNVFGQQHYELSYVLVIEARQAIWKQSEGLLNANWYWNNFYVESNQADIYAETFQGIKSKHYPQGSQIEIKGTIPFMETDNGWIPSGGDSFSSGYDNNSSKDLRMGVGTTGTNTPIPAPSPSANPKSTENGNTSSITPQPITPAIEGYQGDIVDGKRNGNGSMKFKNGDHYNGEWKNDTIHGIGKMIYATGLIYEGEWVKGKKQGKGKAIYKDGSSFEGAFENDSYANGVGTITWADKRKYVGPLKDYQMHGRGTTFHANGKIEKDGTFENGKLTGFATTFWSDEDGNYMREGQYQNGKLNGQGTFSMYFNHGGKAIEKGEFRDNELYNGVQELFTNTGEKFIIEFINGVEGKKKRVKE